MKYKVRMELAVNYEHILTVEADDLEDAAIKAKAKIKKLDNDVWGDPVDSSISATDIKLMAEDMKKEGWEKQIIQASDIAILDLGK